MQTDAKGRGVINILAADRLLQSPKLYATFLLWLLSELFERLPEVGDLEKPKLVFFFDEAHLLFTDAPSVLLQKIEQVVRLVRSKGVGVYFVTQNPLDIPDIVLGTAWQPRAARVAGLHAARPEGGRAAAETFRRNPKLNVEKIIGELGVGEALVSMLDAKGTPGMVERAFIVPAAQPDRSRSRPISAIALIKQLAALRSLRTVGGPGIGVRDAAGAGSEEHGGGPSDPGSDAARRPLRHTRPASAAGETAGDHRGGYGQECHAGSRNTDREADHSRRARFDLRREPQVGEIERHRGMLTRCSFCAFVRQVQLTSTAWDRQPALPAGILPRTS